MTVADSADLLGKILQGIGDLAGVDVEYRPGGDDELWVDYVHPEGTPAYVAFGVTDERALGTATGCFGLTVEDARALLDLLTELFSELDA